MPKLQLLPPAIPRHRHRPALHRLVLRLRARWLGWRGRAALQAVPGPAPLAITASERDFRALRRQLLELNLAFERARSAPDRQGEPGGSVR